ncbi:MAG: hypothetical protein P0Y53_18815 [Candidatus Pseudobacter hemicellulosilyticus]|uniref:Alpha-L-rhamnosidase six-hairpin glycosidase domain-containing protein n=1 Tax=Candidatus Pseudobacter hemicellulosilyticus TaxID=3121375 RepID=A0AAJ5WRU7_9BACT|nr:MAG: hypothetical protein P0Y53_18815 [Pseudobacter sp.]
MTALLFQACHSKPPTGAVYSEWSFQCRSTGEYFYEEQGQLKTGKQPANDQFLWVTEANAGRTVKIRNKASGHYLAMDASGKVISVAADNLPDSNLVWDLQGFNFRAMANCSWYSLNNKAGGTDRFLTQEGQGISLSATDRNKNFAAHWTMVREKGSGLPFHIYPDSVVDASYTGWRVATATSPTSITSNYHGPKTWTLQKDISQFPQFSAPNNTMLVALYNMALEEMQLNLRSDSTFATGALWPDTWTRDVVYSIYFAFSWIHKDISKKTLQKQTLQKIKEALQDTGTGGSWPISTDRVVWALAAWEYYLSTGDSNWLAEAYENLSNTARKDLHMAFDSTIGLFRGEACSMDWRTHTYPNWFSNENIGESFSSGTNALHLFCYDFLQKAGAMLGKPTTELELWADTHGKIKKGLNTYLWDQQKGLYAAYLYPAFLGYPASDRVDIMSNGLCALLGAADPEQVKSIVNKYPLYPYGGAVLYPSIPDDFAYHNKSVWVVWQTPLLYAARQTGNLSVVSHLLQSQIRQGALFLTHKENMTYDTGSDENTALNSDRQLWSVAAYIGMVYRILFGMELTATGLSFAPAIPKELVDGPLHLKNFRYRNASLDITVSGSGSSIAELTLNGKAQQLPYQLPADARGHYEINITMSDKQAAAGAMNLVQAGPGKDWSPVEPTTTREQDGISWQPAAGLQYRVIGPGITEKADAGFSLQNRPNGFYSVVAIDDKGFQSDLSRPIPVSSYTSSIEAEEGSPATYLADTARGFSGKGYIRDFAARPATVRFSINLPEAGKYAFSLKGANGRGPHDVYCYIRSAFMDGKDIGSFILEASGSWNTWTRSNLLIIQDLPAGAHTLELRLNPEQKGFDNNMSFTRNYNNDAYIDRLEVIRL